MVLGKNIAHDMKSGAEGAHFFGALLLTFSFDKHNVISLSNEKNKLLNESEYLLNQDLINRVIIDI